MLHVARLAALAAPALLATACWRDYDPPLDFSLVSFENDFVSAEDGVVIQSVHTALSCPDGEPAEFYLVYDQEIQDDPPVAIVFHSGAFDYVENPSYEDPLDGRHFRTDENRLTLSWASTRVFATFGMWGYGELDPSEIQNGALPAVLAERGFLGIYPPNCWGDLWHDEEGRVPNDLDADGFYRNGRAVAWWMVWLAIDPDFRAAKGFELPVELGSSPQIYLLGLGDGGRAVIDLLWRLEDGPVPASPPLYDDRLQGLLPHLAGVLLDSTPDDLTPYADGTYATDVYDQEGLSRIFFTEATAGGAKSKGDTGDTGQEGGAVTTTVADWTLAHYLKTVPEGDWPQRIAFYWSSSDPRLVTSTVQETLSILEERQGADPSSFRVEDLGQMAHVFTNSDIQLAHDAVDFLLTGQ